MVLTQLQLKWPNHSTQLLTGLKYLFKNEQLVDCTLKCNKHTLKVHRSVLAACSPYFERELENNPLIVVKDMQFNVLQALIEFMYYGETRITEENLTSLIEAAKLFEIKGLSEMDLLTSGENNIVPSVVPVNKNCTVESSLLPENINDVIFENGGSQSIDSALKSPIDEAISVSVPSKCLSDGEDSNSILIADSATNQSHSSRNFVITPPQTESAQILLSLACSYSQKQFLNPPLPTEVATTEELRNGVCGDGDKLVDHHQNLHNNLLFEESFIEAQPNLQHLSKVVADYMDAGDAAGVHGESFDCATPNGAAQPQLPSVDGSKSLLAKLLTRDSQNCTRKSGSTGCARYDDLYDTVDASGAPETSNEAAAAPVTFTQSASAAASAAADALGAGILLECPFLIETPSGYVDMSVENMLNVLEHNEIFPAHGKNTVKIIPKEEVISLAADAAEEGAALSLLPPLQLDERPLSDAVLERIRQDTEPELKEDPEAVVLTRVADDGCLERYVLSSADVRALRQANEQRRRRPRPAAPPPPPHVDVESPPSSGGAASLITRIVQFGAPVDEAIARLPFRACSRPPSSLEAGAASRSGSSCAGESLLTEASFERHDERHLPHHENMFEELDSQFDMDCSIEHMQRDYVAYEEASKNETQLEHNYYAHALKDEDEECVVINAASYELAPMMLLEQSLTNGDAAAPEKANGYGRRSAADVNLNNVGAEKAGGRRNGLVQPADQAESDLAPQADALMSSDKRLTNGGSKGGSRVKGRASRAAAGASCAESGVNALPFKSVKNASSEKKPRRTYKRRAEAGTRSSEKRKKECLNGGGLLESGLVEEIIVDEIS